MPMSPARLNQFPPGGNTELQPGSGVQACNCMILPNFLASRMAFCTWRPKTSLLLLVAHWKDVTNLGLEKSQPYKCSKKRILQGYHWRPPTSSSVSAVSSNSFFKNRAKPGPGRRSLGSLLGLRRQWISYHVSLFFLCHLLGSSQLSVEVFTHALP